MRYRLGVQEPRRRSAQLRADRLQRRLCVPCDMGLRAGADCGPARLCAPGLQQLRGLRLRLLRLRPLRADPRLLLSVRAAGVSPRAAGVFNSKAAAER